MNPDNRTVIADFYKSHFSEVVGYVEGRIRSKADAEDIVQDLFLKLLSPNRVLSEATLHALIYTMARNAATDWWRKRNARSQYSISEELQSPYNPAHYVSYNETFAAYKHGISKLKVMERKILRLNVEHDKPVSEISILTGLAYKQAEYRLGIARKQLRSYIKRAVGL